MTNKEVIEKLQAYFLKQDPNITTRLLANMFVDLNRVIYLSSLPLEEQQLFRSRLLKNGAELMRFLNDENPDEPLTYFNMGKNE